MLLLMALGLIAPLVFTACDLRGRSTERKELLVFSLIGSKPFADSILALAPDDSKPSQILIPGSERSYVAVSGNSLSSALVVAVHEKVASTGRTENHLYLRNSPGGELQSLNLQDGDAGIPATSPDGSRIAFPLKPRPKGSNYRLWLYDLRTGNARQLTGDQEGNFWETQASWRPNGGEIIFLRVSWVKRGLLSSLFRVSTSTGQISSFPGLEEAISGACYAPDGKSLAVWSANGLEVVHLEDRKRTVILPRASIPGRRFYSAGMSWGKVRGRIAFVLTDGQGKQFELWTISPDGAAPKALYVSKDGIISSPQFIIE
jgi:Tol biopolymer transport system component